MLVALTDDQTLKDLRESANGIFGCDTTPIIVVDGNAVLSIGNAFYDGVEYQSGVIW